MAYLLALVVSILSYSWIAFHYPNWLYLGRDADHNLWLNYAYGRWAGPLDITAFNPLQGMTSTLVPINQYLDLGSIAFAWMGYGYAGKSLAFAIYFSEVLLSTYFLGRTLGFSRPFTLAASGWTTLILFPLINFAFGIMGWFASAGFYAHALTLGNLFLCAFAWLGAVDNKTRWHRLVIQR